MLGIVVVAGVKLKNLKANHNGFTNKEIATEVVVAGVKLKNLKANHNRPADAILDRPVVVAGVKLKNLKANHNRAEMREGKSVSVEMQKPSFRESEVERLAGTVHKDQEHVLQI